MKAAQINGFTNKVVNIIELDDGSDWVPPLGHFVHFDESAAIGMAWNGSELISVVGEDPQ